MAPLLGVGSGMGTTARGNEMPLTPEPISCRHTLYVVRHGETEWNAQKRLLGQKDIPLNAKGRRQAAEAGACMRWLRPDFATLDFVTGPLTRTRETMEIMRDAMGLDPGAFRQDGRLKEMDFGRWEGRSWAEIREADAAGYSARDADPAGFVMPDGESYLMLFKRVAPALRTLDRDTIIVSHGGISRTILALLAGVSASVAPKLDIPQDRILMIRDGRFAWLQATADLKLR
jgi:broad specificity phosphatase PhoE